MSEARLKVGDLVRYAKGWGATFGDDMAIILDIYCPKGIFVAKLYWQQASTYSEQAISYLVTVEDYERTQQTARNKAVKALTKAGKKRK